MKIQQMFASQTVSVRVFSDVWACIFCLQVQGCLVLRRISHANWSDHIPSMWGRWVVTSPEYFYLAITHTQNGLVVVLSTLVCVYIYHARMCVCVKQTNRFEGWFRGEIKVIPLTPLLCVCPSPTYSLCVCTPYIHCVLRKHSSHNELCCLSRTACQLWANTSLHTLCQTVYSIIPPTANPPHVALQCSPAPWPPDLWPDTSPCTTYAESGSIFWDKKLKRSIWFLGNVLTLKWTCTHPSTYLNIIPHPPTDRHTLREGESIQA